MDFTILHFAIHIVWRANVICTCRKSGIARKTTVAYPELRLINNKYMNTTEQQFSQLVRDNRSTIYAVCYMFSNDADEVADLFQEVLVKLWNGYETFHGKSDVKTWIYRVTLNTCITIDRKKRSRRKALLSMDVDYFSDEEKSTAQVRMLHERIARLQPLDRAIVLLWLEQISYDEIGDIVGLSAKNVSVRLARIRVQLKNMSNE